MHGTDRKLPVVWSADALYDLTEIWAYYAAIAAPQTDDKIIRGIHNVCRRLENHPLSGRARDEVRPNLRSLVAGSYVVFYRPATDALEIVRVLHGRRDIDRIFADVPHED
jgi:toxin ParE1/3/4